MDPIRKCRVSGSVGCELGGSFGGEAPRYPRLLSAVQVFQCSPGDLPRAPLSTRGFASASAPLVGDTPLARAGTRTEWPQIGARDLPGRIRRGIPD